MKKNNTDYIKRNEDRAKSAEALLESFKLKQNKPKSAKIKSKTNKKGKL